MKTIIKSILLMILSFQCIASEQSPVQIGDLLRINLAGEEDFNQEFQVDRRGYITSRQ